MPHAFRSSLVTLTFALGLAAPNLKAAPLRIAIVGLAHGHIAGFLNGGALVPAGGALHRSDVTIVGVVEKDRQLFNKYSEQENLSPSLYFPTIDEMISHVHPEAVLLFTDTYDHTAAVEKCALHHVNVLMEKPMAVSYHDALLMQKAAEAGHIHVLVDYETTWYASNKAAYDLVQNGTLGPLRKVVVHDGHPGPKAIHVQPEFFAWLTDPKLNGAGALYDFGCYGADLMTWLKKGELPESVTAVTQHLQPDVYPKVDDEANVIVAYRTSVAILQASWNWPFDRKDMEVYGATGSVFTVHNDRVDVRKPRERQGQLQEANHLAAPYDDPLHYLEAVISGQISEDGDLSSLKTNIIVSEILDAARQSAQTGRTVKLPLAD